MKHSSILLACWFIALTPVARAADPTLFNNGTWSVQGTTDLATNAGPIAVSVGGVPVGNFTELKIFRAFTGVGTPQIFSVKGRGAIQAVVPPPGVFGGTFYLSGYWDCAVGYVPTMAITQLEISDADNGTTLVLKGSASNLTSMQTSDFKLKFPNNQANDSVRVEVSYTLYATRDICVDKSQQDQSRTFSTARIAANYITGSVNENDFLRYFTVTDQRCDCCSCYNVTGPVCGGLDNWDNYLVCFKDRLTDPRIFLVHQDNTPRNTPTLVMHFENPNPHNVRPQGFAFLTADPTKQNVDVWGNWQKVKDSYKAGRRVGKFRYTLQAAAPTFYNCAAGACYY
ncbi:MAG: hypothetical protein WCS70_07640 [Verrucomicrobiota bacterium]